jgi:phage tail P2-like protein
MPKYLDDINFRDLLPDSIRDDKTISAAADALDEEIQKVNSLLEAPALYERLDDLPEEAVDALAWQYHVDFWEPDLDLSRKRDLVRESIAWHKYKGTIWAVRKTLTWSGFGDADILEHRNLVQSWIDSGGRFIDGELDIDGSKTLGADAGEFKFMTKHWAEFGIRADAADIELTPGEQGRIRQMAEVAKPARSHLVGLEFYAVYELLCRIMLAEWSAVISAIFDKCDSARVPHFEIIGWGCDNIGGIYVADELDGLLPIDGRADLDGQRPDGDLLDNGHWGTWQAEISASATDALGMDRMVSDTLEPNYREILDMIDGSRDLSVQTIDGSKLIDGGRELSVRVLTRKTYDMLDGTRSLGELQGGEGVWHNGYLEFWQGNTHYREAI